MSKIWRKRIAGLLALGILAALVAFPGIHPWSAHADGAVYYAVKTSGNKFISVGANGKLTATATNVGSSAELFELVENNDGTYSLRSKSTGDYVTSASKSAALAATAASIGDKEKFFREGHDLYLKSAVKNGKYVSVHSDDALYADKDDSGDAASFRYAQNVTKLLEITDNGTSDLLPVLGALPAVSIETISMKRFVALRGELDGKYDAIYIGKGQYNPAKVPHTSSDNRAASHNTTNLENDITMLKANEIVDQFIAKGQLVFLYSDDAQKSGLVYQGSTDKNGKLTLAHGNLYNAFASYTGAGRENVVVLNASGLANLASRFASYDTLLNQRPKLTLSGQPQSYLTNPSFLYRAGDKLTFTYTVPNRGAFEPGRLSANLYLGLDQAVKFGADQIVASSGVTGANGELSYTLPQGYSGLYYWKLEIVDQTSKLRSYETGVIRYRDLETNVRVLQIMPNDSVTSSLKNANNMNQSYLAGTDEYNIAITTTTFKDFNEKMDKSKLNGLYDMLIFGFADSYNSNASITQSTANAVNSFIQTGQSVMFTHDTVFSSNGARNTWIDNFQETTGQIDPWTDLGLSAPNTSKTVQKVNDGLLNQFPFNLNNATPAVATTHNQYFTLDLEDEDVVPWYNITGSNRDPNDSWNHYYTYSKGNVTYSGTGHTNNNFPDWEQKLFVNTMFRAFMGSNHAPVLTVYNPLDYSASKDNFVPSYQDINLSFMPEDYDFKDRNLTVGIAYAYDNGAGTKTVTLPNMTAISGSTVNKTIPNPLPGGGDLSIIVTVTDKTGAKAAKTIPVKVKAISSNLSVKRMLSGLAPDGGHELVLDRNATAVMTYTATPKPIAKSLSTDGANLTISGIAFNEKLPAGLEIAGSLPAGIAKSGDAQSGYALSGSFGSITYALAADGKSYSAPPLTFSITLKPVIAGTLPLNNASLTFKDIGQTAATSLPFDAYSINSIVRLETLSLSIQDLTLVNKRDGSGSVVRDTATIIPAFTPADATPSFSWSSSNPAVVSVSTTTAGNGLVTGNAKGTAAVTVTDAITGRHATANVTVIESGLSIEGPDSVSAGSKIDLSAALTKPDRETVSSIRWSVFNPANGGQASLGRTDGASTTLTGERAGTVTVSLHVETHYASSVDGSTITTAYDAAKTVEISNPQLGLTTAAGIIGVGDEVKLTANLVSPLTHLPITDLSFINAVSWNFVEANANQFALLPGGTGKALTNSLKAIAPGNVTAAVSVQLLGLSLPLPLKQELPIAIKDRAPVIAGTDMVRAGGAINNVTLGWAGEAGTPSFPFTPAWTLSNSPSGSTTFTPAGAGQTGGQLTTGPQDGGRVTLQVSVPTPAGITLKGTKQITIVNLTVPETLTMYQGATAALTDADFLRIAPADLRSSLLGQLRWSSDNDNLVAVSDTGVVTAKRKGTAAVSVSYPALGITVKTLVTVNNTDKY
ncbi:DUF5057 domain-containing protein [Paenibacillus glycinis]|uniref:DUF5057 domain-containing protein n=1 Tax=Paenibacillus glycinis TaxID=2697035 RepID=A0ABW9XRS1_9BACL|nr:DUF5057 domain-containing protein [Paenibacillus glycinis]NBD25350.1 DUF5057 domain-containing protein [Paenibacillus glycinis]